MLASESSLLREWALLENHVVPALSEVRSAVGPRVWADGRIADAVAISVAFGPSGPAGRRALQAFATTERSPIPTSFSLAEIRGLPVRVRRESFRSGERGWVPEPCVAARVTLGLPSRPVDMVVTRSPLRSGAGPDPVEALRPGGLLLVLGTPIDVRGRDDLEAVPGTPFCRRRARALRSVSQPAENPAARIDDPDDRSLARKIHEDDLVARHLNLARSLARRFAGHGEQVQDLRQVAFLGLVLAAKRYDPERNASFTTYATVTILGELKRHFRDKSWMMRVPRSVQETYLAIKSAREELYQELSCSPTITQIAARLRITEEAVLEAMEAGDNFLPQSLDAGLDEDGSGRDVPVMDPAFDVMLDRNLLAQALPRLSQREQLVLKRVFLDGWTQRRVAQEIGVSQMQVSRLLRASSDKIRSWSGV